MIATVFDSRVKVQQVIQNHLPEYILSEFPKVEEFLKQYYVSQEYQSGTVDIAENLDQYLKLDNLTPEVISGITTLSYDINSSVGIITVKSTKGYPPSYGLLKINDEIITYTGVTTNSFTGCIRGFSGITEYNVPDSSGELEFSTSNSSDHKNNSEVINLSSLFLKEFYKKLKVSLTPGLENSEFYPEINVNNFIKNARSFYQAKGTEESIKILFKVLYGVDISVLDLENYLTKPSFARFDRREIVSAELISGENPFNIIGQTIFKSTDPDTQASVSDVEIFTYKNKTYYKIFLFVGYGDDNTIDGIFTIPGKTKVTENTSKNSSIISVDSTIGFPKSGIVLCGENIISYTDKTVNQFLNCTGITEDIVLGEDLRFDETIYSYENGDIEKKVEFRITGSITNLEYDQNPVLVSKDDIITVKNLGENIINPEKNKTSKQIFANSLIYNTSTTHEVDQIQGSIFYLKSSIDKSSLKVTDYVDIINSINGQVVHSNARISFIDEESKSITLDNISQFSPNITQKYSIRRKLNKSYSNFVELEYGNNKVISDVQNLYTDKNDYVYVASNSLPSYELTSSIISSDLPQGYNDLNNQFLQGYDEKDETYSILSFDSPVKFITGDRIFYRYEKSEILGLNNNESYYVEVLGLDNQIKLYISLSFIGTDNYIRFKPSEDPGYHKFILYKDKNEKVGPQKLLRKFPLVRNIFPSTSESTSTGSVGLLVNGVEIENYKSSDKIFYGPIETVKVVNGGKEYDVVNPPKLIVDSPKVSSGTTALVVPVISGYVKDVLVDPQDFGIESVLSLSLTGGNGSGAILEPIIDLKVREVPFDARSIYEGGGLDFENGSIAFEYAHNFKNGEEIFYSNNGNNDIGIGTFYGVNTEQSSYLSNGSRYFAKFVNTRSIKLFPNLNSFNLGINTVGLTTVNNGGIHKFRTRSQKTLKNIRVVNPGSGYENRSLYVSPSGISTSLNTITFSNHNFKEGDLVEYYSTGQIITGLTTTNSYYVTLIDNDTFKLSNAGIGASISSDYERKKYVSFSSVGSGYHIFKYPDIKVNIKVAYADTSFSNQLVTATPVVKGSIKEVYLYEKGSKYGSQILNSQRNPSITVKNGEGSELRPVIRDGKIIDVNVLRRGKNYYSVPDLVVIGDGVGCILRAVVSDNKLQDIIVINSGTGYKSNNTVIKVVPSGTDVIFDIRVRPLTINNQKRFGSEFLSESPKNNLKYSILSYNDQLSNLFSDNQQTHSKIVGWAFDGNPIYGPYGYEDPTSINSNIKGLESGYTLSDTNIIDRPSGFPLGFFIEDFKFDNSGDLDICNGRFCKTPEFPDGTYAYFATNANYPYFIGNFYRSTFLSENKTLDQDFDFNSSKLSRNTFPYKVNDLYSGSESLVESDEFVRQKVKVNSISKGSIENIKIINSGKNYRINDTCVFESNDNGGGLSVVVSEIKGEGISSITNLSQSYSNVVLQWNGNNILAEYYPYHSLDNRDIINITGVTTFISGLKNTGVIGVRTDSFNLLSSLSINMVPGYIEDIVINPIPDSLKVGSIIQIETEILTVLNIFKDQSVVRVKRSDSGFAHTAPVQGLVFQREFTISGVTKYFDSKINSKVYFNPIQTVGVGTQGGGSNRNYIIKNLNVPVSVDLQSIYIPDHPFKTGEKLTLTKRSGYSSIVVKPSLTGQSFNIPPAASTSQTVYVINKSKDYIGLTTQLSHTTTTNGLYFLDPTPDGYEYSLETNYNQIKCEISKIYSKVSISTYHNLLPDDVINLELIPNTSVGIGNSDIVRVKYNNFVEKLLVDTVTFSSSSVDTTNNSITINNHKFKTGDNIFYTSNNPIISGLSTGLYYVYKINNDSISLTETYLDAVNYPPNIINLQSTGGTSQQISLVSPNINLSKNSTLVFDISDQSLNDYNFKIYTDKFFNKEYYYPYVVGVGTGENKKINVKYNESYKGKLYYSLEKDGTTLNLRGSDQAEINFVDNVYNGSYRIFNVGKDSFFINLKNKPESEFYSQTNCDTLEYSTKSINAKGGIKKVTILNGGYGYTSLPELIKINTEEGQDATLVPDSSNIGNINEYSVSNQGFEYFSDKTLRPEAYIYPIIFIKGSLSLDSIDILSGGSGYSSPPNLILKNTETKEIVDFNSLRCKAPYGAVSSVNIEAPIYGMSSVEHEVISVDNSNGVGITSITTSNSGVATCVLVTPIINGFSTPPFSVGDEIFVENIRNDTSGTGYNSKDYDYQFFKVTSYQNTNPALLEFSVSGLTTNPGIAKTYQSGYPIIINKKKYPKFKVNQKFENFIKGEKLLVSINEIEFFDTDLRVVDSNKNYIKVTGNYAFELEKNYKIKGKTSSVIATVSSLVYNRAKFEVDYSTKVDQGWRNDTGKLSENHQVIPDNDYYQNLSYSIKSSINYETFIDPVNRVVHTSGLKNFGDLQIESVDKLPQNESTSRQDIILDVFSEKNVDTINNYLFATDYDSLQDETPKKSRFLRVNKSLTDYITNISNRVLSIDDISRKFSNKDNDRDLFTDIFNFIESDVYSKYLIQVIDITNDQYSLTELVIFTKDDSIYTVERSNLYTESKLGDFIAETDEFNNKKLRFIPSDPYDTDYDIKFIKSDFSNTSDPKKVGINTLSVGCVDLLGRITEVGIGSTSTILKLPKNYIKGFVADLYVLDNVRFDVNVVEVVVDHDGTNTYLSEYYTDNQLGITTNYLGTFEAKIENDQLHFNISNNVRTSLTVNARIVGFAKTESGIGTSRFLIPGQPNGSERSGRYQTNLTISSGISTILELDTSLESSFKSFVRVSYGNTSAIHQVICVQDQTNIYSEQYPFLIANNNSGIGTFGVEYDGPKFKLKFYPDPTVNEELTIQTHSEIIYKFSDYENEAFQFSGSNVIKFDNVFDNLRLAAYDGLNGPRANKLDFDARYQNNLIYKKVFDPSFSIDYSENILNIKNHYFNTGEKLIYRDGSSFIGVSSSPIGIVTTLNSSGVLTSKLPSDVYAIRINEDQIKLAITREKSIAGINVTFSSYGSGNVHELEMDKKLEKTVISIDGIVQKPLSFTGLTYQLVDNSGQISAGTSYISLSGISTIQPTDILKVDDEYMQVVSIGIGTTSSGPITPGNGTFSLVQVERGFVGSSASIHTDNTVAYLYRGSYNIAGSRIYFTEPPRGSSRDIRDLSNLPYPTSTFSGRVFLRQDYTKNKIYDDISSKFTGIDRYYPLTVQGINTTGIETGSGVLFINGVFQTPTTENNQNNNYGFEENVGITSVFFTGITSTNGSVVNSIFDVNQNQLPRGGLIVSLGSTQGLGFAPLVGASVTTVLGRGISQSTYTSKNFWIRQISNENVPTGLAFKPDGTKAYYVGSGLDEIVHLDLSVAWDITTAGYGSSIGTIGESVPTGIFFKSDGSKVYYTGSIGDDITELTLPTPWSLVGAGSNAISLSAEQITEVTGQPESSPQDLYIKEDGTKVYIVGSENLNVYEFTLDQGWDFTSLNSGLSTSYSISSVELVPRGITFTKDGRRMYVLGATGGSAKISEFRLSTPWNLNTTSFSGKQYLISEDTVPNSIRLNDKEDGFYIIGDSNDRIYQYSFYQEGGIVSVGLGSTDILGSGYRYPVSIGISDFSHTGSAASITATVGAGGTLSFNIVERGSDYVNPIIATPEPTYENLEVVGISRRGIGNTTETGKNMLISVEVGPNSRPLPPKNSDASALIEANKQLIAEVALGRMLAAYPGFSVPGGNEIYIDDMISVLESITYNLKYGGNDKVYESAKIYIDSLYFSGEETESIYAFEQVKSLAIQAMRNETITIGGYSSLTQYKDNTIIGDVSGVPGVYGPTDCADVASAIGSFVGIVTNAILSSTLPSKTVAPGSLFEVKSFKVERPGYGFQYGDVFKPVGLVTALGLTDPLAEFQLEVTDVFSDSFSAWQFGELDYIDSVKNLQDGVRRRFPLIYKGELISFEKDPSNAQYPVIELKDVLLIFINGVLQQPGYAYNFDGGSSFIFTEPPTPDANISIFFYRGTRGVDSKLIDVKETLKIGDSVQVRRLDDIEEQDVRTIEDFTGANIIQTNIYTGLGINEDIQRSMDFTKQKRDLVINENYVYKSRDSLESQIYPTAKIIKNVSSSSTKIFVDNSELFGYEQEEYSVPISKISGIIINGEDPVSAAITAVVSSAGTISSLNIVSAGSGYTSLTLDVKISAPKKIGVGVGTTATATVTIVNGSVSTPITITNPGFGYSIDSPPQVITPLPNVTAESVEFERESINIPISKGFTGFVTGITTSTGVGGNPLALKLYLRRPEVSETFNDLEVGFPIYIFNTSVGSGLTSIDSSDSSIVAIGTEYVNNIYYVHSITRTGPEAVVTTNIASTSNISGINTSSNYLNPIGNFSWGVLSAVSGSVVSVGVTGLTVNSGLSSFPTIQRRGYGLRENGSLEKRFVG